VHESVVRRTDITIISSGSLKRPLTASVIALES